jgi:carbamoyl-phosphate synthase small subunit
VAEIIEANQPTFGICLGHQMIAEACGVPTYKMHNGHRGINHPIKNLLTGHCEISSQNHGFAIAMKDAEKSTKIKVTHVNLNDKTVEGLQVVNKNAFSVQYHPEAAPGPYDSRYLFDQFITNMKN